MADRLYVVESEESMSIVRAVSEAQALKHVIKDTFKTRKATPDDVEAYLTQGGTIETAGTEAVAEEVPEETVE